MTSTPHAEHRPEPPRRAPNGAARVHREADVGFRSTFRPLLDDRARPIRRLDRRDLVRASRSDNPGLAMLARRLAASIKSETRRTTPDRLAIGVVMTIGVLLAYGFLGATATALFGLSGAGVGLVLLVGLIVLANRVYAAYVRRGALSQIARTAVAEGVCGSCAFSLQGAPEGPNGCLVCPECGAAWRSERVVMPYWERPVVPVLRWTLAGWLVPGVRVRGALFAPDDRGRFVQSPDSRLMLVRPELLAEIGADERRRLRRAMRRVGRAQRIAFMIGLIWLPALLFWLCWTICTEGSLSAAAGLLGIAAPIGVAVLCIPLGSAFGGPHRTARVLTAHARCGSCLHPLHDAPTDADGRRICPRCGAAWLTPGSTPPAP